MKGRLGSQSLHTTCCAYIYVVYVCTVLLVHDMYAYVYIVYMYMCMSLYIYVYMYARIYLYMCRYTYTYIYIYVSMYLCIYIYRERERWFVRSSTNSEKRGPSVGSRRAFPAGLITSL